jgi:hypothetical protein
LFSRDALEQLVCHGDTKATFYAKTQQKQKETHCFTARNKVVVKEVLVSQACSLFLSLSRKRLTWPQEGTGASVSLAEARLL